MTYNQIIQIGKTSTSTTDCLVREIMMAGMTAVIINIDPSQIPGFLNQDQDGHHTVWQSLLVKYQFSAYETILWEEGIKQSPYYRDPMELLRAELVDEYGIDINKIYAIQYDQHIACEYLQDEFRDGHCSDCRGSFLDVLFPIQHKAYSSVLIVAC